MIQIRQNIAGLRGSWFRDTTCYSKSVRYLGKWLLVVSALFTREHLPPEAAGRATRCCLPRGERRESARACPLPCCTLRQQRCPHPSAPNQYQIREVAPRPPRDRTPPQPL